MAINPVDPNIDNLPSAYDTTNSDRFEAKINRNPSFNMTDTPERVTAEWGNEGDGFTRAVQQRLSFVFVNAREHGAKGDGATNDDAAFTAMVAVGAAVYYLPPGTYIVTGDVTLTAGSVVFMAGASLSGGSFISAGAITLVSAIDGEIDTDSLKFDSGPTMSSGTGSPEGAVTAPISSLFMRTDGTTVSALYLKETGVGNTGWVALGILNIGAVNSILADEATPSVAGSSSWRTSGTTTITNFDDMEEGQVIYVRANSNVTIQNGSIVLAGAVDFDMLAGDVLVVVAQAGRREIARSTAMTAQVINTRAATALASSATPSVTGRSNWTTTGTTAITDFTGELPGQVLWIRANASITITHSAGLTLSGSGDFAMTAGDMLGLIESSGAWREIGRLVV